MKVWRDMATSMNRLHIVIYNCHIPTIILCQITNHKTLYGIVSRTYRCRTVAHCHVACTQMTIVRETCLAGTYPARESVRRHGAARSPAPRSASPVRWCHGHRCLAQHKAWWPSGAQQSPVGTSATFLNEMKWNKFKT